MGVGGWGEGIFSLRRFKLFSDPIFPVGPPFARPPPTPRWREEEKKRNPRPVDIKSARNIYDIE